MKYGGETLYRFDAAKQRIVYHYFDATGGYSAVTEESRDGRWVEAWRVIYSKQAP